MYCAKNPNTAGCVLLAVSALLLTASAITWRTWVLVACFLVAGVLDASGSPANVCSELATILVVPGVLALLAMVFRAPKHNGVPADDVPLRTMRPVLGAAAFLIVMLAAPALETAALHIACVAAAILWALLIALLPREGPRPRKGRVAAPRLLVLAYVVPSVGLAATDMVLRLTGRPALALEMDYLVGLVQAIGVGTLYIMIQLIDSGLRADRMARVTP